MEKVRLTMTNTMSIHSHTDAFDQYHHTQKCGLAHCRLFVRYKQSARATTRNAAHAQLLISNRKQLATILEGINVEDKETDFQKKTPCFRLKPVTGVLEYLIDEKEQV